MRMPRAMDVIWRGLTVVAERVLEDESVDAPPKLEAFEYRQLCTFLGGASVCSVDMVCKPGAVKLRCPS